VTVAALLLACAGCGDDDTQTVVVDAGSPDACTSSGSVMLDVTGPDAYACHESFKAKFTVTNNTCQTLTITSVRIAASVLSSTGDCTPPATSMNDAVVRTIGPGGTAVVQDITGGTFCCFDRACPADFTCDQKYDFSVVTSAGTFTDTVQPIHVNLQSCDVVCASP
jgi:hypothetical protein